MFGIINFIRFRRYILKESKKKNACIDQYLAAKKARGEVAFMNVVFNNYTWLYKKNILNHKIMKKYSKLLNNHKLYYNKSCYGHGKVIFDKGEFYISKFMTAYAYKDAIVHVNGYCTIYAKDTSQIFLTNYCKGYISDYARAFAYDQSIITALNFSKVTAFNNSVARLYDASQAKLFNNSVSYAYKLSKITAYDNSIVISDDYHRGNVSLQGNAQLINICPEENNGL